MWSRSKRGPAEHSLSGPIGVFDSGVGGLTVAAALRKRLPHWPIIYLGDTARLPYGTKSKDTVRRYTERNVAFLRERGVGLVVVACNSASALVLEPQDAEDESGGHNARSARSFAAGSDRKDAAPRPQGETRALLPGPVIGVVEPGARRAAQVARHRVGVVATESTIGSGAYPRALRRIRPDLFVVAAACPLLVPLVEEGWLRDPVTREVMGRYLEPLLREDIDTLILGCTHYPLLAPLFAELVGPDVQLVDSAETVSESVATLLEGVEPEAAISAQDDRDDADGVGAPAFEAYVTDNSPRFGRIAETILGEAVLLTWVDTP